MLAEKEPHRPRPALHSAGETVALPSRRRCRRTRTPYLHRSRPLGGRSPTETAAIGSSSVDRTSPPTDAHCPLPPAHRFRAERKCACSTGSPAISRRFADIAGNSPARCRRRISISARCSLSVAAWCSNSGRGYKGEDQCRGSPSHEQSSTMCRRSVEGGTARSHQLPSKGDLQGVCTTAILTRRAAHARGL